MAGLNGDMDNVEIKVTPSYDFNSADLGINTSVKFGGMASQISTQVINLEDQAVKDTLIKLGWTPPVIHLDEFEDWGDEKRKRLNP